MTTDTRMATSAYDTCADRMTGVEIVTVGMFRAADTLTFTREEWEAFRTTVEDAFDTIS